MTDDEFESDDPVVEAAQKADDEPATIEAPNESNWEDEPAVDRGAKAAQADDRPDNLRGLSDAELGRRVRRTAAFRAAVACEKFAEEATELRDGDGLAFDRLVDETHAEQGTGVSAKSTTEGIVNTFIDVVAEHAELADHPEDAADRAASKALED